MITYTGFDVASRHRPRGHRGAAGERVARGDANRRVDAEKKIGDGEVEGGMPTGEVN